MKTIGKRLTFSFKVCSEYSPDRRPGGEGKQWVFYFLRDLMKQSYKEVNPHEFRMPYNIELRDCEEAIKSVLNGKEHAWFRKALSGAEVWLRVSIKEPEAMSSSGWCFNVWKPALSIQEREQQGYDRYAESEKAADQKECVKN